MEFEYEIKADDYAAANVLYHRLVFLRQRGGLAQPFVALDRGCPTLDFDFDASWVAQLASDGKWGAPHLASFARCGNCVFEKSSSQVSQNRRDLGHPTL